MFRLFIICLLLPNCVCPQNIKGSIQQFELKGKTIEIYLPPSFDKKSKYPVLFFTDGQICFSNPMNLAERTEKLIAQNKIDPLIIVGVHSGADRMDEYIPYADPSIAGYESKAKEYTDFLMNELLTYIELHYAKPDRVGIAGFSFGGLFAAWAALKYPDKFQFSAAFSPSMWVADYQIFKEAENAKSNQIYYMDIGTKEWNYYVPFVRNSKLEPGKNIFYYEVEGAAHDVSFVSMRAENALLLFTGKDQNPTIIDVDIKTEVIQSAVNPSRYFLRLNPVATYNNGLKSSLLFKAKFKLINESAGEIRDDGSFRFTKTDNLEIIVSYEGTEKKITVEYEKIEAAKKQN